MIRLTNREILILVVVRFTGAIKHPTAVIMEKVSLVRKQTVVSKGLCRAVREVNFDDMKAIAEKHGLKVKQA